MALRSISQQDLFKQLNRSGIGGTVRVHQALTAIRLFIQSEFPELVTKLEPLFIRHHVLVIRSLSPAAAQVLKTREAELIEYIQHTSGIKVERIQFRV